jgi:hypothetical protein
VRGSFIAAYQTANPADTIPHAMIPERSNSLARVTAVLALASSALLLNARCWAAQPARAAPQADRASPAGVLPAFTKALGDGDATALAAAMTGKPASQAWATALAAQVRGFRDLDQALAKRYGKQYARDEAGMDIKEQIEGARDEDLHTDLKAAKLGKPDGDTIPIITDESAPDDRQGRLLRVEGVWKVDVDAFSDYFSPDDAPRLKALAEAAAALARDVAAGKFATLEDAGTAIDERLSAAEDSVEKKPSTPAKPDPGQPGKPGK